MTTNKRPSDWSPVDNFEGAEFGSRPDWVPEEGVHPLDRLTQKVDGRFESKKANAALHDYCKMGVGRSQQKLLDHYRGLKAKGQQPPTVSAATIRTWSSRFYWAERSAWYDEDLQRRLEEAAMEERKALDELWRDRYQEMREKDWDMGVRLREAAMNILRFLETWDVTEFKEVDPMTGTVTITKLVRPNVTLGQIGSALSIASALQKNAVGEHDDDEQTHSGQDAAITEVEVALTDRPGLPLSLMEQQGGDTGKLPLLSDGMIVELADEEDAKEVDDDRGNGRGPKENDGD